MNNETEIETELVDFVSTSRQNLISFRKIMLISNDDVATPKFHYLWSEILLNSKDHTAIEGFRESAKSQIVLRAYPLYCLAFPEKKRSYIIIIRNNDEMASQKLKEIQNEFLTHAILKSNCARVIEKSANRFSVDVYNDKGETVNVIMEAKGKGASIRGLSSYDRRPDIVIIDDPQDFEDSLSQTVLEKDWDWFLGDIMFLGRSTRIFLIGNNLGERCIIERIFQDEKQFGFKCFKIPAIVDGKSSWEEKFSIKMLEEEKEDYRRLGKVDTWYRERMCEAISEESRRFQKADFQYYTPQHSEKIASECNIFIAIDLAISEKKTADYTAIITVGVNKSNYWFILDCSYGRYDLDTSINEVFKQAVRWKPSRVGFEKVAFQAAIEGILRKEMSRRNQFFNLVDLKADKAKELRINALQPRFKAHTIYFPERASWLTELESELLMFPKSSHDDLIDSLAFIEQIAYPPFNKSSHYIIKTKPEKALL